MILITRLTVEYLKELYAIYCISFNHKVLQNEDDKSNFKGHITAIKIKYEPKVDCTQEQIVKEFRSVWPVINRVWLQFKNEKKGALKRFFIFILDNYMIQYPNICELIPIMLSASSATGPLERSYAKLAKICYKDRNALHSKNIKILYLLAVLQIENH